MNAIGASTRGGRRRRRFVGLAVVVTSVSALVGLTTTTPAGAQSNINNNGTLTVLITQAPNTLDPAKASTVAPYPYQFEIYDRLIQRDVKNQLKPMLATNWTFSNGGRTLTMNLRKDVKFNDGTPMTSKDVKASLDRSRTVSGTAWATQLGPIASVDTPSAYQVVLSLKSNGGDLPAVLSTPAGAVINAKAIAASRNFGTNPGRGAGSGPRIVSKFVVNDHVDYVRADNDYWDPAGNRLAKVTITRVADATARLNALRAGQADLVTIKQETTASAKALAKAKAFKYWQLDGAQHNAIFLNSSRGELAKLGVRQALNYAIDRNAIADFMDGTCPSATQLFRKGQPGYAGYLENQYNYDPAKAKRLLAQAGESDGVSLTMSFPAGLSPYVDLASVVQDQLAKVGVKLKVVATDAATINPQFNAGSIDAMFNTMPTQPDSGQIVDLYFTGGANLARGVAPEMAGLAAAAKDRTQPVGVWQQKYKDIAGIAGTKALYVPLCDQAAQYLMSNKVGGIETMPGQLLAASVETRALYKTK